MNIFYILYFIHKLFYVLFISIIYVTILYLIHEYSIPMRYSKNTRVFKKCKSFSFLNVKNKILYFYFFYFFIVADSIKLLLVSFIRFLEIKFSIDAYISKLPKLLYIKHIE